MIKKLFILLLIAIAAAAGGYFYIKNQIDIYADQVITLTEPETITIDAGSSFRSVLRQFESKGWVTPSPFIKLITRFRPELKNVKAGTFMIQPDMSFSDALIFISTGKEHQFAITFVEGSRFSEWRSILSQADSLTHKTTDLTESDIADQLAIGSDLNSGIKKLEGLFLAETYHYTAGMSDLDILARAHNNLNHVLDREWANRQKDLPLKTPYEALILASIIEKETALESERKTVASVFINRLNRRMRLQTDPTVIYGMGDKYTGNIRKKDLKTPTPYNTYTINGLPPTPIAMAGEASIHAALNPENTSYLYFVASGKGGHVFSKNLKQHNRAVQNYLRELRKK
ncbi:endolytic transglycosylase MltG [Vibrio sp. TH_r3]|uniref:endolytic transglycosylase MltG n=1 Tax=Vibrio sp. TH_r3 TaxID=3082084 RepID=UPI002953C87C|nr:endolytic transglycosylase MltG [Vibrio sp. TH_r3]MDV7103950.1 endolytic transglycosylase MltG [Vibrio sp. TH_r3]